MIGIRIACCALLLVFVSGRVFAEDPSLMFLKAYQDFQAAEVCERNGQLRDALDAYAASTAGLEEIQKVDSKWQTMVVDYRLRKAKEGIERMQDAIQRLGAPDVKRPAAPIAPKSFEIDIPAPNIPSTPSATSSETDVNKPAAVSTIQPDSNLIKELAEARAEINRLKTELTGAKADLSSAKMEVEKTKTEMVAAKSSLAQAEASLASASTELDSLRAKVDLPPDEKVLKLSSRIADLEAENAFLQEDRERLTGKLRRASDYIRETKSSLDSLVADRDAVAKERNEALSRIKTLKNNQDEIEGLRIENAELKKATATIKKDVESAFQKEKDELLERLSKQEGELEKMTELEKVNKELAVRLDKTEQALFVAIEEKLGNAELDLIQNELTETQGRLQAARELINDNESKTRLLFLQLEKVSAGIARLGVNPEPSPEQQNLIEESKLLKEIILSQINDQNDRLKSVSVLEKQIAELQEKSNKLTSRLTTISQQNVTDGSFVVVKKETQTTPQSPENSTEVTESDKPQPAPESPKKEPVESPAKTSNVEPAPSTTVASNRQTPVLPQNVSQSVESESAEEAAKLLSQGNAYGAKKIYLSLLKGAPNDPTLLSNLALVQLALGENTLSTKTLKRVLEINPNDLAASMNLANAQTRLGNVVEAARILQEVLKADPNNAVAFNYLGIAYGKTRGRHLEARGAFEKCIELDSDYQNAHFNLAVSYARTAPTSLEMAKKHYEIAKKLGAAPDSSLEKMLEGVDPAR